MKNAIFSREAGAWGDEKVGNENDVICLRIADFDYQRLRFNEKNELTIRNYKPEVINKLLLKKGDILIEKSGGGEKTPVGRAVIFDKDYNALFANFLERLRTKNTVDTCYFLYILTAFYQNKHMVIYIKQTTGIQNLDITSMINFEYLPFPPLEEQHRISTYLDTKCEKIDSIIARQQEVIEKLKAYKLSVITEAVTKGLNPDVRMKESEIRFVDSFPEQWENRKMLSILSMRVVDGPHESPELIDEGIPYISATAIENGKINFELMRGYISEEYCNLCDLRYKPQKNDILVIKLGASTGQVAMVETDERFNIWVPLAAVRCNEQAVPRFVYYAFQSDYFIKQMELSWTFGTQQTLGVKTIERLRIIVPNVDEQQQIADYLDKKCSAIDSAIAKKQAIIEKLTAYKKSLIYEVVTGKREV